MSSTAASSLRAALVSALSCADVATAAGMTLDTWVAATAPHVFVCRSGYIGGRNRGRLPFVEIDTLSQGFIRQSEQGGMIRSQVLVRVHVGGANQQTAMELMEAITAAGISAIRDVTTTNYMGMGDESVGEAVPGPWGWQMDTTLTIEQSYERSSYEVIS